MTEYVTKDSGEREQFETGAKRDVQTGKGRYDLISPVMLRRLAGVLERGAEKYGDRNWEKGMPMSRCMNSTLRHLNQYLAGERDEDHLAQALWNIMVMIHFEELRPELHDLCPASSELPWPGANMKALDFRDLRVGEKKGVLPIEKPQ